MNNASTTKITNHGVINSTNFNVSLENKNNNAIENAAINLSHLFSPINLNFSNKAYIKTKINKKVKTGKKNPKNDKSSSIVAMCRVTFLYPSILYQCLL